MSMLYTIFDQVHTQRMILSKGMDSVLSKQNDHCLSFFYLFN